MEIWIWVSLNDWFYSTGQCNFTFKDDSFFKIPGLGWSFNNGTDGGKKHWVTQWIRATFACCRLHERAVRGEGVSDESAVTEIAPPFRFNFKAANPHWAERTAPSEGLMWFSVSASSFPWFFFFFSDLNWVKQLSKGTQHLNNYNLTASKTRI